MCQSTFFTEFWKLKFRCKKKKRTKRKTARANTTFCSKKMNKQWGCCRWIPFISNSIHTIHCIVEAHSHQVLNNFMHGRMFATASLNGTPMLIVTENIASLFGTVGNLVYNATDGRVISRLIFKGRRGQNFMCVCFAWKTEIHMRLNMFLGLAVHFAWYFTELQLNSSRSSCTLQSRISHAQGHLV